MVVSRVLYQAEKACQDQTLQLICRRQRRNVLSYCQMPEWSTFYMLASRVLYQAEKTCQGQTLQLISRSFNDEEETFYKISVDLASLMQTVLPNVRRAGTPFVERSRFSHETQGRKYVCLTVGTLYIIPAQYQICIIKRDAQIGLIEAMKPRVKISLSDCREHFKSVLHIIR